MSPALPRVVLIGASNLTRCLPVVLESVRLRLASPVRILVAAGHGRSLGMRSRVLVRTLPGILESGLWQALERDHEDHAATYALVTDVGNDVVYGVPTAVIAGWLEEILARLRGLGARIVLTRLPIASLHTLTPFRYRLFKTLLFPTRSLSFRDALARTADLDERVGALARRHDLPAIEPPRDWYGLDPIHIRRDRAATAWHEILAAWRPGAEEPPPARVGLLERLAALRWRPDRRWILGVEQRTAQPCRTLDDGSSLSLY